MRSGKKKKKRGRGWTDTTVVWNTLVRGVVRTEEIRLVVSRTSDVTGGGGGGGGATVDVGVVVDGTDEVDEVGAVEEEGTEDEEDDVGTEDVLDIVVGVTVDEDVSDDDIEEEDDSDMVVVDMRLTGGHDRYSSCVYLSAISVPDQDSYPLSHGPVAVHPVCRLTKHTNLGIRARPD